MRKHLRIILGIVLLGITSLCCFHCSRNKTNSASTDSTDFTIVRFDTDLYRYLFQNASDTVLKNDSVLLNILGEDILALGRSDSSGFYSRLRNYFSEPTLKGIYKDEQEKFTDLTNITKELSKGLNVFLQHFPEIKRPKVYMHVSGLEQNIVVVDSILSLSADMYLGSDYSFYQKYVDDYKRPLMTPDRIVPDYLLGYMMAEFPFVGKEDVLLDKMLYEGKLRYILSQLLPQRKVWEYVGYNKEQYKWCTQRQFLIWTTILENRYLFAADEMNVNHYLNEAAFTSTLPVESPGRVGVWLGYQIISAYMKENPQTSWQELMKNTDYQEILKQSKYKPK